MPPKEILNKLKEYQTAANSEVCDAIFARWINGFAESLAAADSLETLSIQVQNAEPSKDQAPENVLTAVMNYRMLLQNIAKDLNTLKTAILLRIPEIKEEDNLGVNVQIQVNDQLKKFIGAVSGGGGKDEGSSIPSVFVAKEYLAGRAEIESKVLGADAPKKDDDKKTNDTPAVDAPKSKSLVKQLALFDADAVARVSRAYREVVQQQQFILSLFTLNGKKLYAPRAERVMH